MDLDDASTMLARSFSMLLIDDKPDDARRVGEMFQARRANVFCDSVESTAKACDYLRQTGEFVHVDRPDLILLNVGLPVPPDQDFLRIRQGTPEWREIPVIAFSSPGSEAERQACLHRGADVYAVKPGDWEAWRVVLSALINVYSRRRL